MQMFSLLLLIAMCLTYINTLRRTYTEIYANTLHCKYRSGPTLFWLQHSTDMDSVMSQKNIHYYWHHTETLKNKIRRNYVVLTATLNSDLVPFSFAK